MNTNSQREWDELIDRHLRGELTESEKERLAEILDRDEAMREDFVRRAEWDTRLAEGLRGQDAEAAVEDEYGGVNESRSSIKLTLAIAAAALLAVAFWGWLDRSSPSKSAKPPIAKIKGLNGSLQWTLDGGKVVRELPVGAALHGGSVEGVTPESMVEIEFNDGSTAMISGVSMLTFSDVGQKQLYLRQGEFTASVNPQPAGKPMLVHTRTATLEVLGTRFSVEADSFETMLNVSEGKVRVERLSDGNAVVVPAKHRVTAAADRDMSLTAVPDSVDRWVSRMHRDTRGQGKWLSPGANNQPRRGTVPFTPKAGLTIYTMSLPVSTGESPPVVLSSSATVRVQGSLESQHNVYVGMTLRQPGGDFAGRFQVVVPAEQFDAGETFELELPLGDFHLDPSLAHMKQQLPARPDGLVVGTVWCHTLFDQVGLAIGEIALSGK